MKLFSSLAIGLAAVVLFGWRIALSLTAEDSAPKPPAAAENTAVVAGPRAVLPATTQDVGEIPSGKPARFEFSLENAGTEPLEVVALPRCGCTVIEYDKTIAPGQTGKIRAELRTARLHGKFQKSVELHTNDPNCRVTNLMISGRVVNAVEIEPRTIPTAVLPWSGPKELSVALQAIPDVAVTRVECNVDYASARLIPEENNSYRLTLTIGPAAPPGQSKFIATLSTTAEHQPQIPVTINCAKGILITPSTFRFGGVRRGGETPQTSMVMLRKSEGQLQIRQAVSSDPNVDVEIVTLKEGSLYRLKAHYRGDLSALQDSTLVTVETDDPDQPKLEIPIRRVAGVSKR